jgi:PAS domain S-box-containing protein
MIRPKRKHMKNEQNLFAIFKVSPNPNIVLTPDAPKFTIVAVNDAYLEIFKASGQDWIGKGFFDAFPCNPYHQRAEWLNTVEKAIDTRQGQNIGTHKYDGGGKIGTNGKDRYFDTLITPVIYGKDEIQFLLSTTTDVTEVTLLQQSKDHAIKTLKKKEKSLRETQRIARVGSWEIDLINDVNIWSDELGDIFEIEPGSDPRPINAVNFYKGSDNEKSISKILDEAVKRGIFYDTEFQIVTAKGNERWVKTSGKPIMQDGKCVRIYGSTQDITQMKVTERALLESRDKFRTLMQSIEGIVWEANAQTFEMTFVSPQVLEVLGFPPEEYLSKPFFWENHIHPDDRQRSVNYCRTQTRLCKNYSFDYRMIRADRSIIWIKDVVSIITENGKPQWLRGIMVDITETRRLADLERLKKEVLELNSQKCIPVENVLLKYTKGIENIFPDMICSVLRITNNRMYKWPSSSLPKGYEDSIEGLLIGENTGSFGTAAYLKESVIVSDIANDSRWENFKHLAIDHGLKACWSQPVINSNGNVMATFGIYYKEVRLPNEEEQKLITRATSILQVILENRQNAALLKETNLLMKQGQEIAHFGSWNWEVKTDNLQWSDTLYEIAGLSKSEFSRTLEGFIEVLHPEDKEVVLAQIKSALINEESLQFEERMVRPNGEIRYIKSWGKINRDEAGLAENIVGACLDITESNLIQENLMKSESRLRALVDAQTVYVIRIDFYGNFTYANKKYLEDFDWFFTHQEYSKSNLMSTVTVGHHDRILKAIENCIQFPKKINPVEIDQLAPAGVKPTLWHFICITNSKNQPTEIQCIGLDISDQKKTEQALRASNERYTYVNKATNDAIYDWDILKNQIKWGDGYQRIFGFKIYDDTYQLESWLEKIHPLDVDRIENKLYIALNNPKAKKWNADYLFQKADGSFAHVEENGYIIRDAYGKAIRMIGALRDVTRQKAEEQHLKLLESVVTNTSDAVLILEVDPNDKNGLGIVYTNEAFTNLTGIKDEHAIGKNPEFLFNSDLNVITFDNVREFVENWKPVESEPFHFKKGEQDFWTSLSMHPVINKEGRFTHWVAIGHDVTEQTKTQFKLEYKSRLLAAIAEVNSNLLQYDNPITAIDKSFKLVGEAVNADRAYYFQNDVNEAGDIFYSQILEWNSGSFLPQIDNILLQNIPLATLDIFVKPLSVNRCFSMIVKDLPESEFKSLLAETSVRSLLILPIFVKDLFYGFIGFDDCRNERTWNEDEISFLKTIAANMAIAIERAQAEKAVQLAYEEKNSTLESIRDGFFSVTKDWIVTFWNKEAEQLLGTKKHEILGRNLWEVHPAETGSISHKQYHRAIKENIPVKFEDYYAPMDRWFEISAAPKESGLSCYFQDITERKKAEAELKMLHTELKERSDKLLISNSELEKFAYIASHDLQEPLRMITSFLGQIEKRYGEALDERGKQYIYFAVDGAKRMRQIILDLLEYSRVGRAAGNIENIDLNELIAEIKILYRKKIDENHAEIKFENLPTLRGFTSPLRQVFLNLISNALKYQPRGQKAILNIQASESETYWQFCVSDNGIGIEAEYFDKIFIIFQRLHSREEYSGTGMGLAITRKIVESFGGKIWLESEEGKGTSFYFTITKIV